MKQTIMYETNQKAGCLLHANELPWNISEEMRQEIINAIATLEFQRYPDTECTQLIKTYCEVASLFEKQVLAGNGSDELLGLLIGAYLGKGKTLYTLSPDFSMYDYYAGMYEAKVLKFKTREDGSYSVNDFVEFGRRNQVDMIMLSNPNNPTGFALSNAKLRIIAAAFPRIPVVIDEAYGEFYEESMRKEVECYPNLYVTRTLSKAYGLAGMRVGFVISNSKNIEALKKYKAPYTVNALSQLVACVALRHAKEYQAYVEIIKQEREKLYQGLRKLSFLQVFRSSANYIYGKSKQASKLIVYLQEHGVFIRSYEDDSFRITIGSAKQNKYLLALCEAFEKEVGKCDTQQKSERPKKPIFK